MLRRLGYAFWLVRQWLHQRITWQECRHELWAMWRVLIVHRYF